jgi:hypothetical protein
MLPDVTHYRRDISGVPFLAKMHNLNPMWKATDKPKWRVHCKMNAKALP